MIAGMPFANVLSPTTRKHMMSKSFLRLVPCNPSADPLLTSARADLELMKEAIEELKASDENTRSQKIDVSSGRSRTALA